MRGVGNIVYNNLEVKLKAKEHPIKNGLRIVVVLGILFFLYRRYFKK